MKAQSEWTKVDGGFELAIKQKRELKLSSTLFLEFSVITAL